MDEKFEYVKNGHMYIKKDKETNEEVSWSTVYTTPEGYNLDNKKVRIIVLITNEVLIVKQVARVKKLIKNLLSNDRDVIDSAKKNGYIDLGTFIPSIAEEILTKGIKMGLDIKFEDIIEEEKNT